MNTSARPELVIIEEQCVTLGELPFNSPESLANAKTRKENKKNCQLVLGELESHGFATSLITIAIGALGHRLPTNHSALLKAFSSLSKAKLLLDQTTSTAI